MSKFYAVKKGRKVGIFDSWDQCKIQVNGFPNAIYKSFNSYMEAKEFLKSDEETKKEKELSRNFKADLDAYIDGSYNDDKKMYSFAGILIKNEKEVMDFAYTDTSKDSIKLRNVAGELRAAMHAIELAIEKGAKSIDIFYDYAGIEEWADGNWKANNDFTKKYVNFIETHKTKISIRFNKVKAHSGNEFNEKVDSLAKKAIDNNYPPLNSIKVKNKEGHVEILNKLKPSKKTANMNLVINDEVYDNTRVYGLIKELWKKRGSKLKDIIEFTTLFDSDKKQFIFKIKTANEIIIMNYKLMKGD